jgi:hypothetical protein
MDRRQKTKSQLSDGDQLILATVEVPRANDLFKVFAVAEVISEGADTPAQVAVGLDLVVREGAYYLAAARALRLVRKLPQGEPADYALGNLGESYLKAKGDKAKAAVMVGGTLGAPHVVYVAERLGLATPLLAPTPRELHDVSLVEAELVALGPLSGDTPRRRANTLVSWMKTVDRLARSLK